MGRLTLGTGYWHREGAGRVQIHWLAYHNRARLPEARTSLRRLAERPLTRARTRACHRTGGRHISEPMAGSPMKRMVVGEVTGRFGRLDVLVNDAAYNKSVPFPDLDGLSMAEDGGRRHRPGAAR